MGERYNGIVEVRGSIPLGSTTVYIGLLSSTIIDRAPDHCFEIPI